MDDMSRAGYIDASRDLGLVACTTNSRENKMTSEITEKHRMKSIQVETFPWIPWL
jgi:hypothetical protein